MTGTPERTLIRAWRGGQIPAERGAVPVREGIVALVSAGAFRKSKVVPDFLRQADSLARGLLGLPQREEEEPQPIGSTEDEIREWKLRYLKAQTAARAAAAAARQRENDIQKGLLVRKDEVELDAAELAVNLASAFNRIPERVASMCVGCDSHEIAEILRKEIASAFEAFHASVFLGVLDGNGLDR